MKQQLKIGGIVCVVLILLLAGCTEQNEEDTLQDNSNLADTENENDQNDQNDQLPSSLLGHWKFDETSGTVAEDSAGTYDGTVYGDALWSPGKKGNALYFDGIDDYVQLPEDAVQEIGRLSTGTIAFWINYTSLLDSQTIMPLLYLGNEDINDDDSLFIIEIGHYDTENPQTDTPDPTNKKLYVTWVDITKEQYPFLCFDSNENLEENTWIHITLLVSTTGTTAYLNGEELTNRNYNFGTKTDQYFLDTLPVQELFCIGYGKTHYDVSSDFLYYKGYIDDLRIYNKTLSGEEIQNLI